MEKVGRQRQGYKIAGTTRDGVTILEPKVKPTHFTSREMRRIISKVLAGEKSPVRASGPSVLKSKSTKS